MRLTLPVAAAVLLLGCAASRAQPPKLELKPDPKAEEIGGKSLPEWIKEIPHKDRSRSENAIRTVLLFGPERAYEAVPVLLRELAKHTSTTPLDQSVRVNCIMALGAVLGGVKDAEPRHLKEAVGLLGRALRDNQAYVRYRAAQSLGQIGPDSRPAVPELITMVKDPSTWEARQAAAQALGAICSDNEDKLGPPVNVQQALFGALNDSAHQVRLAAVRSLTLLGAPANPDHKAKLLSSLNAVALKDPEPTIQIWAHMAIMSASHEVTPEHLNPIAKKLQHPEVATRVQAAQALGAIGLKAKATVPALAAALRDEEPVVVLWSAMALGRMDLAAARAVPALEEVAKDAQRPEPVRRAARDALTAIRGKKG